MMRTIQVLRPHHSGAFMLVELLVVISIISLLIAILLPALSAARDAAQATQCLSDQRQIGLATLTYAGDNDDYMVPVRTHADWNSSVPGITDSKFGWPAMLKHLGYMPGGSMKTSSGWESFSCAADPNKLGDGDGDLPGWNSYYISFGYNWEEIGASISIMDAYAKWYTPARTFDVLDAGQKVAFADSVATGGNPTPLDPRRGYNRIASAPGSSVSGRPDPRHSGSVNIIWVDGHGSAVNSPNRANLNSIYDKLGEGGMWGDDRNAWQRNVPGKRIN